MSLVPFLLRDLWNDDMYARPSRLLDQHFGVVLDADDLLSPLTMPRQMLRSQNYYRPWRTAVANRDTGSTVSAEKDKFQISLDVQQFKPEEISVKTIDDSIVIEGKHEEKQDEHGFIKRHFVRRYTIPKGHDSKDVVSNLSSDGVLTVTAPKRLKEGGDAERIVQITHTGPAKAVSNEEKKADKK